MKTRIILALFALTLPLLAGPYSSPSTSRSSSPSPTPSRSYSSPSVSKPSAPAPSPSKYSSPSTTGTASASTAKPVTSSGVNSFNRTAAIAPGKSKSDYVAEFKAKEAAKYTVPKDREPSVRPTYIPQTTYVGGSSYNIVFQPGYGYGYYSPAHIWMAYDPVEAMAVASYSDYARPPVVYHSGWGFWNTLGALFLLIFVIALVVGVIGVASTNYPRRR